MDALGIKEEDEVSSHQELFAAHIQARRYYIGDRSPNMSRDYRALRAWAELYARRQHLVVPDDAWDGLEHIFEDEEPSR